MLIDVLICFINVRERCDGVNKAYNIFPLPSPPPKGEGV